MYCNYCRASNPDDSSYCARCGRELIPTAPSGVEPDALSLAGTELGLPKGTRLLNRYTIVRELGVGGMGCVYLAQDDKLDMPVAIKVLREVLSRDPGSVKRLIAEARHSMILAHGNVVRVHNFEDGQASKFLVMEYVEGDTLAHRIARDGRISEEDTRKIAIEVCRGLEHAHAKGVIHRDLKPGNVLMGKDGSVKIADFGIARVSRDSVSRLTSQQSSGTLLYMSPEQLMGKSNEASDIYSLGVMLYELLTGDPPFRSGDIPYQIRETAPEPLAGISPAMSAIVMRCLEKKPESRFASARELREELDGTAESRREEARRLAEEERRRIKERQLREAEERQQEELRCAEAQRQHEQRSRVTLLMTQGSQAFHEGDYAGALAKWEQARNLSPEETSIADAIDQARNMLAEQRTVKAEGKTDSEEQRRRQELQGSIAQPEERRITGEPPTVSVPPQPQSRARKPRIRTVAVVAAVIVLGIVAAALLWDEYGPHGTSMVTRPPAEPPWSGPAETGKPPQESYTGTGGRTASIAPEPLVPVGMRTWTAPGGTVTVPFPDHWQTDPMTIARIQAVAPWYAFGAVDMGTRMSIDVHIMQGIGSVQEALNHIQAAALALGMAVQFSQPQRAFVGGVTSVGVPFALVSSLGSSSGWTYITMVNGGCVNLVLSAPPPMLTAAIPTFEKILSSTRFGQ